MLKPQYVNGHWRKPEISGKKKAELKYYFEKTGVPWIYEKEKPECRETSAYNKRPKGAKHVRNFETRLATIRKNLSTQDEKLEKLRSDRIQNKPHSGVNKYVVASLKALQIMEMEGKRNALKATVKIQDGEEEVKKVFKKKATKGASTSKGGKLGKKAREVVKMTKANAGFEFNTSAAKDAAKDTPSPP